MKINEVEAAVGEEIGWRGYMMPRLKERFSLFTGRLLGGILWGVWHWLPMLAVAVGLTLHQIKQEEKN